MVHLQVSRGPATLAPSAVLVAAWADRILVPPCGLTRSRSWFHPLLTAEGVILIAIREPREGGKES
jgi:hypothetical protein